ncbi:LysR family transcriptional regulator [Nocardia sp. CA-145437]|uniref:LysR family transcriptional regulator n=1 Tax=Nocardia sp. CA-145437 TaxID=3239980 RepID=UPI003D9566C8
MLFRQLEYFVALARERHFARAAAACYVSQPALSEAIRKLEHELKVPLVKRGRTFEGLTPEGERLVLWARRILADRDALQQEVVALQTGLTGELRLGVIPAAAATVALLTDPFCAENPLVKVRVDTGLESAGIIDRLRRFELDAGLVYPDEQDASDLTVTPLYSEEHVVLAAEGLVTGAAGSVDWAEVVEMPLCLLRPGMRGRTLIDDALAGRGLTAGPQLETDSVATLFGQVATGRWATIVPASWLRTTRPPAGARVLRPSDPVTATIALVTLATEPVPLIVRAFTETARSVRVEAGSLGAQG